MPSHDGPAAAPAAAGAARRRLLVPGAIAVVTALLVAGVFWVQREPAPSDPTAPVAEASARPGRPPVVAHPSAVALPDLGDQEARDPDDLLAEGPVDAPVVLIVFSDPQCPFCARWSHETLPVLREHVERGELRIEHRDVNIYGEDSERAARATLAAAQQGHFTEYHDRLFAGGEIRSPDALTEEALIALAAELGLDTEQFTADLRSEQVAATIAENAAQGIELGAMATPSFVLDGTPMVGAQPTAVFTEAIDRALAETPVEGEG